MHCAGGYVATLPRIICPRRSLVRQHHFAVEDDVSCLGGVRVVGIRRVRSILPDVRVQESFAMKLSLERFQIGVHFSFGRNNPPATRATIERGTNRTPSAPNQFVNPDITELFPAASARSPTRATFSAVS